MVELPEVLTDGSLVLQRYRLDDVGALKESSAASQDHLIGYMPWASEPPTDESALQFVTEAADGFCVSGNANYAMIRDGSYVGSCGIHDRVGPGALEIGYWVDVRHTRNGIATAAARLLTEACFDAGVERVVIRCDASNDASANVARRLGYELVDVRDRAAEAPSETGREMVWVKTAR
jgi:RimJ/RimL family protein N-acetyltransferase